MGLDMYLSTGDDKEVGYWRKANAIHAWFVKNVQYGVDECQKVEVSVAKLKKLRTLVNKVLKNNKLASELLPTQSGFFFGSTEIDKWYMEELESTKEILDRAIAMNKEKLVKFYYESSW